VNQSNPLEGFTVDRPAHHDSGQDLQRLDSILDGQRIPHLQTPVAGLPMVHC